MSEVSSFMGNIGTRWSAERPFFSSLEVDLWRRHHRKLIYIGAATENSVFCVERHLRGVCDRIICNETMLNEDTLGGLPGSLCCLTVQGVVKGVCVCVYIVTIDCAW